MLFVHHDPDSNSDPSKKLSTDQVPEGLKEEMTAEEAIHLAFLDSFYYRIDQWILIFKKKISLLESAPKTVETQLDLMKYYFNLGGLYVELSHIMGLNSKYRIRKIENNSLLNIRQSKRITRRILTREGTTAQQKAQAYFYLGASEGSLGVMEFRAGNILSALINGFQADNHLERALFLDPEMLDAHLGLGVYRYGNSRLGGLGNFILQGGKDQREVGLDHIERAISSNGISTPLAIKTLGWFYIAVQINPDNANLPKDHLLSPFTARVRVHELIKMLESRYFNNSPEQLFIGNKELAMMKAIQFVLDGEYAKARDQFEKILHIIEFLRKTKGYEINPEQDISIRAGIEFCDMMLLSFAQTPRRISNNNICSKINRQVAYMDSGGRILEYDTEKLRDEINAVFYQKLVKTSRLNCRHEDSKVPSPDYAF